MKLFDRTRLPSILVLTALIAAVVTTSSFQRSHLAWSPIVPWGLTLQTDRIYYPVGSTLAARFVIPNYSGQTTWGWVPVNGGNGCIYRFSVHDAFGQGVWVPGTISGGSYSAPGCLFGTTNTLYAPGTARVVDVDIPLIYQNPAGIGTLGANLAAGAYELRVKVTFQGPKHVSGSPTDPGTDFSAVVPFRIE